MVFLFGIMKTIQKNFCNALKKWVNRNFKGNQKELGKFFNVSQGYISNVMAGRRCGDETWRRFVAAKIGMDYDAMIGIEKPENNIVRFESVEDRRHYEVVQMFENQPMAITINEMLAEIEKLSPEHGLSKALDQVELVKIKMEIEAAKKRGKTEGDK
jgi:predicted transcriptional regulator